MMNATRSYRWLFWSVAIIGLSSDQFSKYGIFARLYNQGQGGEIEVVPGAFKLVAQYTNQEAGREGLAGWLRTLSGDVMPGVNRGALFGMGGNNANGNTFFAIISVTAALAIIFWSTRPLAARDRWLCLALGLILAGTLGNLYDRFLFHGVRDFLWVFLVSSDDPNRLVFNWPVFNVADCCLVCGAGLLLVQAFFAQPHAVCQSSAAGAGVGLPAEPAEAQ